MSQTRAQKQRYDYNRHFGAKNVSMHYHGYKVLTIQYLTTYRAGNEKLRWRCEVALPYYDLSVDEVLADAAQIWPMEPIKTITSVHPGSTATVQLGDVSQTFMIVAFGQTGDGAGMALTIEAEPTGLSPLWGRSAADLQKWLDDHAQPC